MTDQTSGTTARPDNPHRLPRTARPSRYDLFLEPDLDHATFAGEVAIAVEVLQPTDTSC